LFVTVANFLTNCLIAQGDMYTESYYTGKKIQVQESLIPNNDKQTLNIWNYLEGENWGYQQASGSVDFIHQGIYINMEEEFFYTGNGFQFMPKKISVIIYKDEKALVTSWMPYIPSDIENYVFDKEGKKRRIFDNIAEWNANLYQIVRPPIVGADVYQEVPHGDFPEITKMGLNNLIRCFMPFREKLFFSEQDGSLKYISKSNIGITETKFTLIISSVSDQAIMFALGKVWNSMIEYDKKAGEYSSESARILSELNEINLRPPPGGSFIE